MLITNYSFGRIEIDGKVYQSDLIISTDKIISGWWRKDGHKMFLSDIQEYLPPQLDVLVVGCGFFGIMKVQQDVKEYLQKKNIELVEKKTKDACKIYNEVSKIKKTVACLHLTC